MSFSEGVGEAWKMHPFMFTAAAVLLLWVAVAVLIVGLDSLLGGH